MTKGFFFSSLKSLDILFILKKRYTYLGNKGNSEKNIHLKNEDGSFKPAYLCPGIFENDSRGIKCEEILKSIENSPAVFLFFTRKNIDLADKVIFLF